MALAAQPVRVMSDMSDIHQDVLKRRLNDTQPQLPQSIAVFSASLLDRYCRRLESPRALIPHFTSPGCVVLLV